MVNRPINLFYSYSHKDDTLREELEKHLKLLKRSNYLEEWHDRKISAGAEWKNEIDEHLEQSEIVLLLVSADFITSDYCYDIEMKAALKMHVDNRAVVIPVILRDCNWKLAEFAHLQALPTEGRAITGAIWHTQDAAFTEVSNGIQKKVEEIWKREKAADAEVKAPASKPVIRLRQIPPPRKYFVGRDEKLKELKDAFTAHPLILIDGAGGIGKTQFVAKFIEDEGIREKCVWYECHPTSQPDDIIRGAGFEELLKGENRTDREKFSAFKDKVEEHDLALFLDNFQEVQNNANFKAFLSFFIDYLSAGHLIIICRDNIITPSFQARRIHLPGLSIADSIEHAKRLIRQTYPENDAKLEEEVIIICETFQGYPLTVDLAIDLLCSNVPVDDIISEAAIKAKVDEVKDELISQRLLNKIFTREDAKKEEQEFLKKFSAFRGSVQEHAVKAIVPDDTFRLGTRSLRNRNLLSVTDNYYSLHPLVREFCYELLEDKAATHKAIAGYYLQRRAEQLNPELEEKIFYHFSLAGEWEMIEATIVRKGRQFILQGELERLLQMIDSAEAHNLRNELFEIYRGDIFEIKGDWEAASQIFERLSQGSNNEISIEAFIKHGEMCYRRGAIQQSRIIFETAIDKTKATATKWEARALDNYGMVLDFWGQTSMAMAFQEQALSIRKSIGNPEDIATSLSNIAFIKYTLGHPQEALMLHEESLVIGKEIGNKQGIAASLSNTASIKDTLGHPQEALMLHEESLVIGKEIGNKQGIATSLSNIASIKYKLGHPQEALKLHEESLVIRKEIGNAQGIAISLFNIASIKDTLGHPQEALKLHEESLAIEKEIGNRQGIAASLSNIAFIKYQLGHPQEALMLYEESLKIGKEIGNKQGIATSLSNIASIKYQLGHPQEALTLQEESLAIKKEIGNKQGIATSLANIASIKDTLGHPQEALKLHEESLAIEKEIGNKQGIAASLSNIASIKYQLGHPQEALTLQEESLAIEREIGSKQGIATSLSNIASIKDKLGHSQEALKLHEESLGIKKEIGHKQGIAASLSNIASIKYKLGHPQEALKLYEESLAISSELNYKSLIGNSFNSLGYVYDQEDNYSLACDYFLRAIALYNQISVPADNAIANIAALRRKVGNAIFKPIAEKAYSDMEDELKQHIDLSQFLGEPKRAEPKIGRNDPCPCGSGKKYKQCHGKG